MIGEKYRREQRVDRKFRTAGDERQYEHRDLAVFFRIHRTRCHQRRHHATEAHDERHDALACQTDTAHDSIERERNTRHVACAVKCAEEEEQAEDERYEDDDTADTADDPVNDEREYPVGYACRRKACYRNIGNRPCDELIERIGYGLADPLKRYHEYKINECQEDRDTEHGMCQHRIESFLPVGGSTLFFLDNGFFHDRVDELITKLCNGFFAVCRLAKSLYFFDMFFDALTQVTFTQSRACDGIDESMHRVFLFGNGRHDGHTNDLFELFRVDVDALRIGFVHHVERQYRRDVVLEELKRQE